MLTETTIGGDEEHARARGLGAALIPGPDGRTKSSGTSVFGRARNARLQQRDFATRSAAATSVLAARPLGELFHRRVRRHFAQQLFHVHERLVTTGQALRGPVETEGLDLASVRASRGQPMPGGRPDVVVLSHDKNRLARESSMFGGGRLSVDLLLPGAMSGRQNEGRCKI